MSYPTTHLDPSLVAARYPSSTKPSLPTNFVVPSDVRQSNVAGSIGLGGLAAVAAVVGGVWWMTRPSTGIDPRRKRRR